MNVVTLLVIALVIAALLTIVPFPRAKKRCILGYRALCTFTPISTVVLIMTAGVVGLIGLLA